MASDSHLMDFRDVKFRLPYALLDELRSIPTGSDAQLFCKDNSDNDTVLNVTHTRDEYLMVTFPGSTVTWNGTLDSATASIQNFRRQEKRKRNVKSARQLLGLDQKSEETVEEDYVVKKPEEVHNLPKPAYTGKKRGRKPKGYYEQLQKEEEECAKQANDAEGQAEKEEEVVLLDLPESPLKFNYHAQVETGSVEISVEDIMTGRSPSKTTELGPMMTRRQRKSGVLPETGEPPVSDGGTAVLKDPKMLEILNNIAPTELLDEHFEVITDMDNRRAGLRCKRCGEVHPTRKEFLIHLKSHVNFTPWHCPLCSYRAHHKSLLAKHLNIHSEIKSFACEICGQTFSFKEKLQYHMKYHNNERSCSCPHCDMAFHEHKTLRSHIASIHKDVTAPLEFAAGEQDNVIDDPNYVAERHPYKKWKRTKYCGTPKTDRKTMVFRVQNSSTFTDLSGEEKPNGASGEPASTNESKVVTFTEKEPKNYILLIDNFCTVKFEDGFKRYTCKECQEVFRKKMPFLHHLRIKHRSAKPFKCASCDYVARSKPNVFTHMKIHSQEKDHVCNLCGRGFYFGYKLALHMKYHLNAREFKCDMCNSAFNNKIDVQKHKERIHTTGRPYLCDTCGKGFKYSLAYRRHQMTHIPGKREICVYCNKPYKSKQSLRIHMQCHTTIFQCQICDKNINSYTAFVAHKNMHDPNYVGFPCKNCGKVLQTKTNLEKHLATAHSDARPFKCEVCEKAFKIIEHLKLHMITHDTVKKFQCTICGYTMKRKASLITHMRRHLHVNPFVCEECGKWFQEKVEYQTHLTTHSGESPSWCPFCDRTFSTHLVLEKHIESAHTGEHLNIQSVSMEGIANVMSDMGNVVIEGERSQDDQLFLCEQCNSTYESQEILAMHILTDHMRQHLDQPHDVVAGIKTETLNGGTGKIVTVQNYPVISGDIKVEGLTLEDVVNTVEINTDSIPVTDGNVPLHSMIIQGINEEQMVVHVEDMSNFFMSGAGTETVVTQEQNEDNAAAQVISEQAQAQME